MRFVDLRVMEYQETARLQEGLRQKRLSGEIPDTVLFVEHPPVISVGKDPKGKNDFLGCSDIPVVESNRGGRLTYHGPGQLVIYFICHLQELGLSVRSFVCLLQKTCTHLLQDFGLPAELKEGAPGVWTGGRKIAFIGLHVSRHTTIHGISFNVGGDLSAWHSFVPCGLQGLQVTSLERELKRSVSLKEVQRQFQAVVSEEPRLGGVRAKGLLGGRSERFMRASRSP